MRGMIKRLIFVFTIELLALTMYATGHELANVKRIVFSIQRARVNAEGHLVECEVKVRKPADNQPLAAEMEALLKAYHPWRVSYINGEYRANGIEGYTFPYIIEER